SSRASKKRSTLRTAATRFAKSPANSFVGLSPAIVEFNLTVYSRKNHSRGNDVDALQPKRRADFTARIAQRGRGRSRGSGACRRMPDWAANARQRPVGLDGVRPGRARCRLRPTPVRTADGTERQTTGVAQRGGT